jgi:Cu-Zn family superoxide dismutase
VPTNATAHADLRDTEGRSLGTLTLLQTAHGVLITGDLTGLPAGVHAIHVHESGRCEAPFTSAGGHLNLGMRTHGIKSANGPHVGDLANFNAPASGAAHVEQVSRELTLIPGPIGVFDADGASLVVHAGADDYMSDPAGNSGNRIACGPIAR